ncbi:MAG: FAD-dependent oxidoreductase [Corallococcus sp.]|nr:FAD-dependent oxidoreductase [Corallococcus sp.]
MKKIAIIGGGVAGLTAAIYALRSNAEVTLFEQFGMGGYVANLGKIENYPSYVSVEGWQLASNISKQAKELGLSNVIRQKVVSLTQNEVGNFVVAAGKEKYEFPSVVVATGTTRNKLGIEDAYVGKGVSCCATCDGNFFKGAAVAVVGGGEHAVREALYLADLCEKVYVLSPFNSLDGEEREVADLQSRANVSVLHNSVVTEILGDSAVTGMTVALDGETRKLSVSGVFVAVGSSPSTEFIRIDGVETVNGYIKVDEKGCSSVKGLFAAGDVTSGSLKQIVTACSDGAKAGAYASVYAASRK